MVISHRPRALVLCLSALSAVLVWAGCLDLQDPAGRRCDADHTCGGGRQCIEGLCQLPAGGGDPDGDDDDDVLPGSDGAVDAGDAGEDADAGADAGVDAGPPASGTVLLQDDFESYTLNSTWPEATQSGPWQVVSVGEGSISILSPDTQVLRFSPKSPSAAQEQYTAKVTSTGSFGDVDITVRVKPVGGSAGSDTGAFIGYAWHGNGVDTGYRFVLIKSGWALQRLTSGGVQVIDFFEPPFVIGTPTFTLRIRQVGGRIEAFVQGNREVDWTDSSPYTSGPLSLIARSVSGHFDDVSVTQP